MKTPTVPIYDGLTEGCNIHAFAASLLPHSLCQELQQPKNAACAHGCWQFGDTVPRLPSLQVASGHLINTKNKPLRCPALLDPLDARAERERERQTRLELARFFTVTV